MVRVIDKCLPEHYDVESRIWHSGPCPVNMVLTYPNVPKSRHHDACAS